MTKRSEDDWALLSNRLLLLQEIMVGLSQLPFAEVVPRAAEGVAWVFDGGVLHNLKPEEISPLPLVSRGRVLVGGLGEVYLAYFAGPPEPRYLLLSSIQLADPQEFRLAALYFEHLLAALTAAGYREELERQAKTDWLTGLANRRSWQQLTAAAPHKGEAVGFLELQVTGLRTQAEADRALRHFTDALSAALPERGALFRVSAYRVALRLPDTQVAAFEKALGAAELLFTAGWARQPEQAARTLGELAEQAEVRLEGALAARWYAADPTPPTGPTAGAPARQSLVRVHSGAEALRLAVQERVASWPLADVVHLVFDTPHGFALECLRARLEPLLIVSDGPSRPYLRDLQAYQPQGLIVGTPNDEALFSSLTRVLRGEQVYEGPVLDDDGLYPRERMVWQLVVRGLSNGQIAATLGISEKTVANYVTSLQDKLFLNNRVELVLYYLGKLEVDER